MANWFKRVAEAQAINSALRDKMPKSPPRGSYWWWAAKCREYTGAHFLDSGAYYGYAYERSVLDPDDDPIRIEVWNGCPANALIHLPHWLHQLTNAGDEVAGHFEVVLRWLGNLPYTERMHWPQIIEEEFIPTVLDLMGVVRQGQVDRLALNKKYRDYLCDDVERAAVALVEADAHPITGIVMSHNTYNGESNLDQDVELYVFKTDETDTWGYEKQYVVVRIHTGCDIRGGYATPVIAAVVDPDYLWDFRTSVWCARCMEQHDLFYFYAESVERAVSEGRVKHPVLLVKDDGRMVPAEDGVYPERDLALYCPECGQHEVLLSNPARGF